MAQFCTNCGAEIEPGGKFCTSCGARAETAASIAESAAEAQPAIELKIEEPLSLNHLMPEPEITLSQEAATVPPLMGP